MTKVATGPFGVPLGLYGDGDGLLDPRRLTPEEVLRRSPADVAAQRAAMASSNEGVRRLRAVFDRTFGRA
mgnify:CR=1 FL=1